MMGWNNHSFLEARAVPWWLGRAREDFARRRTLFWPVPFNMLVVWWDWLYLQVRRGSALNANAWVAGYNEGHKDGFAFGRTVGKKEGREEVARELEALVKRA